MPLLTSGASGLPKHVIDTRILNVNNLPSGPFQLTPGVSYDDYSRSPVHRFYQMWQQADCGAAHATAKFRAAVSPICSMGRGEHRRGQQRQAQPPGFNDQTTGEGATAMGFYNVQLGDMPYFTKLARKYAISDNYHQPVMGGTGANSIMLGAADAYYYTDGHGHARPPPAIRSKSRSQAGTNNWYTQDGEGGGTYSNCSMPRNRESPRSWSTSPRCPATTSRTARLGIITCSTITILATMATAVSIPETLTIPPSPVRTIADTLLKKKISWKYYGEGWNFFVSNPDSPFNIYCKICNPFLYETAIMTKPSVRTAHLKDTADLYNDIAKGQLPAVSYVNPGGLLNGIPALSKVDLRGLHQEDRRAIESQGTALGAYGGLHHRRRRRRLLRFRLYPAARFLRRRHPHSLDRRVAFFTRRPGGP